MAFVDLSAIPNLILKEASLNLGSGSTFSVHAAAALFDGVVPSIDTLALVKKSDGILYKGIVRARTRSLDGESVTLKGVGAEFACEGQPWTPTKLTYNNESTACGRPHYNATIQQVVDNEYTNNSTGPRNWFTAVIVPDSAKNLLAASTNTWQRSFLSIINSIISIYPHLKWAIDYDPTAVDIFPIGKLVLVDMTVGRTSYALQVGGTKPIVAKAEVTEDATDTAKNIRVFGRGNFTEVEEILTPGWDPADEKVAASSTFTAVLGQNFLSYALHYDLGSYPIVTVTGMFNNPSITVLFPRLDYVVNFLTNGIVFLNNSYWIDQNTGKISSSVDDSPPATSGNWRRPAGYGDAYVGKHMLVTYSLMGQDCYRRYSVSKPIANLRLQLTKVPDPLISTNPAAFHAIEKEPIMECYRPSVEVFLGSNNPVLDPPHIASLYTPKTDKVLVQVYAPYQTSASSGDESGNIHLPPNTPENLFNDLSQDAYNTAMGQPGFQEGLDCVYFQDRQIAYIQNNFWPGGNPPPTFFTWKMRLRYTKWEEIEVDLVGDAGDQLYATVVMNSIIKYTDILGNIIVDDTQQLQLAATLVAAYYGILPWGGTIDVVLDKDAATNLWIIPYVIGDKVTFTGEVSTEFADFKGIITSINVSNIDTGILSLTIGRTEPNKNPFAPPPPGFVDLEGYGLHPLDVFGLERLS